MEFLWFTGNNLLSSEDKNIHVTRVLRLPRHCESTATDRLVRAEPEIQGVVGTEELCRVILATVLSNYISRGAVSVMDLQEVVVAVAAALQVKKWECNT